MKKFLLGIILPVLTLVTLIGTGFATWYFGAETATASTANMNVTVEKYAQLGSWEVTAEAKSMVLDQPSGSTLTGVKLYDAAASRAEKTIVAKYIPHSDNTNPDMVDNSKVKVTCTITIPSALYTYIELNQTVFNKGVTDNQNGTYEIDLTQWGNTITLDSKSFSYKTRQVPTTVVDYNNMVNALKQVADVTVAFNASFNKA